MGSCGVLWGAPGCSGVLRFLICQRIFLDISLCFLDFLDIERLCPWLLEVRPSFLDISSCFLAFLDFLDSSSQLASPTEPLRRPNASTVDFYCYLQWIGHPIT